MIFLYFTSLIKKSLMFIFIVNNLMVCQETLIQKENKGALYITIDGYPDQIFLIQLEKKRTKEFNAKSRNLVNNLEPGTYLIKIIKDSIRLSTNEIYISPDSISIMPLTLLELTSNKGPSAWRLKQAEIIKKKKQSIVEPSTMTGKIDGHTEPLKAASILIEELNIVTYTDKNGFYCIKDILPGVYNIYIDHLIYQKQKVLNVKFINDSTSIVDVSLMLDALEVIPTPIFWEENITSGSFCKTIQ